MACVCSFLQTLADWCLVMSEPMVSSCVSKFVFCSVLANSSVRGFCVHTFAKQCQHVKRLDVLSFLAASPHAVFFAGNKALACAFACACLSQESW